MRVRDPARVERIIETAAELFGEFGYTEVRMEDIATRAGVAKGTLYLYYKDKDDLYLALILQRMTHLFERTQVKAAEAVAPATKLVNVVREAVDYFHSQPHIFAAIQRFDNSGTSAQVEALRLSRDRFLNLTAGIFAELNRPEQTVVQDPDLAARLLCGMMRELLFTPPQTTRDLPEQIVDILLNGIAKR